MSPSKKTADSKQIEGAKSAKAAGADKLHAPAPDKATPAAVRETAAKPTGRAKKAVPPKAGEPRDAVEANKPPKAASAVGAAKRSKTSAATVTNKTAEGKVTAKPVNPDNYEGRPKSSKKPKEESTHKAETPLAKPKAGKADKTPKPKEAKTPRAAAKGGVEDWHQLTPHATKVLQAITEGRVLELTFKDADSNTPRNFEPRSLSFDSLEQAWHVWGWDRRYNADRHHRLDTLAEVSLVDGVGRAAQGPYPENATPNHIGGWLGGDPIAVKAVLSKQSAYYVRQAPAPFPSFTITEAGEGRVQVEFTATDFRAIAKWCMQFGDGVQVLEPGRLIDRLKQVGHAWGARPQGCSTHPHPAAGDIQGKVPANVTPQTQAVLQAKPAKKFKEQDSIWESDNQADTIAKPATPPAQHRPQEGPPQKARRVEVRVERL